jgi:hypothetical protein
MSSSIRPSMDPRFQRTVNQLSVMPGFGATPSSSEVMINIIYD